MSWSDKWLEPWGLILTYKRRGFRVTFHAGEVRRRPVPRPRRDGNQSDHPVIVGSTSTRWFFGPAGCCNKSPRSHPGHRRPVRRLSECLFGRVNAAVSESPGRVRWRRQSAPGPRGWSIESCKYNKISKSGWTKPKQWIWTWYTNFFFFCKVRSKFFGHE